MLGRRALLASPSLPPRRPRQPAPLQGRAEGHEVLVLEVRLGSIGRRHKPALSACHANHFGTSNARRWRAQLQVPTGLSLPAAATARVTRSITVPPTHLERGAVHEGRERHSRLRGRLLVYDPRSAELLGERRHGLRGALELRQGRGWMEHRARHSGNALLSHPWHAKKGEDTSQAVPSRGESARALAGSGSASHVPLSGHTRTPCCTWRYLRASVESEAPRVSSRPPPSAGRGAARMRRGHGAAGRKKAEARPRSAGTVTTASLPLTTRTLSGT